MKSKKASKTNSFVGFLGESTARQSAFWNYLTFNPTQPFPLIIFLIFRCPCFKVRQFDFTLNSTSAMRAPSCNIWACFERQALAVVVAELPLYNLAWCVCKNLPFHQVDNVFSLSLKETLLPIIEFSLKVKLMGFNSGYLLKSFLLYIGIW